MKSDDYNQIFKTACFFDATGFYTAIDYETGQQMLIDSRDIIFVSFVRRISSGEPLFHISLKTDDPDKINVIAVLNAVQHIGETSKFEALADLYDITEGRCLPT